MHEDARKLAEHSKTTPHTNQELLAWLEDHTEYFKGLLVTAAPSRRTLCQRLEPISPDMPAVPRLQPADDNNLLAPLSHLSSPSPEKGMEQQN